MSILSNILESFKHKQKTDQDQYTIDNDGNVLKNGDLYIGTAHRRTINRQFVVAHVIKGQTLGKPCLYGKGANLGNPSRDQFVSEAKDAFKAGDWDKLDEISEQAFKEEKRREKENNKASLSDSLARTRQTCEERKNVAEPETKEETPTQQSPKENNNTFQLPFSKGGRND